MQNHWEILEAGNAQTPVDQRKLNQNCQQKKAIKFLNQQATRRFSAVVITFVNCDRAREEKVGVGGVRAAKRDRASESRPDTNGKRMTTANTESIFLGYVSDS